MTGPWNIWLRRCHRSSRLFSCYRDVNIYRCWLNRADFCLRLHITTPLEYLAERRAVERPRACWRKIFLTLYAVMISSGHNRHLRRPITLPTSAVCSSSFIFAVIRLIARKRRRGDWLNFAGWCASTDCNANVVSTARETIQPWRVTGWRSSAARGIVQTRGPLPSFRAAAVSYGSVLHRIDGQHWLAQR